MCLHASVAKCHSITSSARAESPGGPSIPSAFTVLRLITNLNLVAFWTGMSARLFAIENPARIIAEHNEQTQGLLSRDNRSYCDWWRALSRFAESAIA